ncbi:hypothetical protein SK128_016692 [Halocaridina rubra]|uniref:Zinc carboxypeptidase A 1 n=1 Tax=Halocaridina rubra TaxID=373956 RepID=A0AAN8XMQ9_HALRR
MKTLLVLASFLLLAAALPTPKSFLHGAQVFRVVPKTEGQIHYLSGLIKSDHYDFWTEPRAIGKPVDIMAKAFHIPQLKSTLLKLGLKYEILVSNVAQQVEALHMANEKARAKGTKAMDWTSYHTYDEITEWLDSLATDYPSLCTVEDVGTSYEGRTMKLLKLGTGPATNPGIFIDGGIHAREWISPATVTYIINEFVQNSDTYADILAGVNFYIMPSINPDGYAYTWSNDRLWRKTRSETGTPGCRGADPNRNWGFHWMEAGASSNPCSDIFAGSVEFSEVEMQNVRDQILKYQDTLVAYLTFHSYSQLWMYPWGYTTDLPSDWQELDSLAQDAVSALTGVHGTSYDIGSSTNILYAAAGGSDDWAKGVGNVKYSYTIELRDTGFWGFQLPPEQIIPTGEETFEALKVVANFFLTPRKE